MILTLEVVGSPASSMGEARRHVFSAEGGTIGRAKGSDWVLSHTKVSGRHAVISFQDGVFYVEDTSTNGVFINSPKNRLLPSRRYALKSGDQIIIDPYEIDVSITTGFPEAKRRSESDFPELHSRDDPFGPVNPYDAGDPFGQPRRAPIVPPVPPAGMHRPGEVVPLEELDPLKLLEGPATPKNAPRQAPNVRDLDSKSALAGHYQPPAVLTPPPAPRTPPPAARQPEILIPADYDPLADDVPSFEPEEPGPAYVPSPPTESERPPSLPEPPVARSAVPPESTPVSPATAAPTPIPVPVESPAAEAQRPAAVTAPPDVSDPGLAAVLVGAGLEKAPITAEFARKFGEIFRVVVSGVMDVLQSRQHIKDEFRMRMTQFRRADNNPLKFSANVDDALHNLLVKRNAAYLEPVEAFEDAFDDLRDHQIAMLAGMRVAFESMLAEFDPNRLQQQFDRQLKRTPLLRFTARFRYWELFRDHREDLAKDPEAAFRKLFGEEFARAYEEQLNRLKAERRSKAAPRLSRSSDT
jgi:type VI secretion system FHA domain protein